MNRNDTKTILPNGSILEYIDSVHLYLLDGVILPSVTQVLNAQFGHKYDAVPPAVLARAAARGTAVHAAVENWIENGEESDLPELAGYKQLQLQHDWHVVAVEKPVVVYHEGEPFAAGRCDQVLQIGDRIIGADIKRTYKIDKNYLAAQLSLYAEGWQKTYQDTSCPKWDGACALWLRNDRAQKIDIDIAPEIASHAVNEYLKARNGRSEK